MGAAGAAAVVALLLGGPLGVLAALLVSAGAWFVLGRLEPVGVRRRRASVERELPFAVDLLATCLAAGSALDGALRVVGASVGGALGEALGRAASAVALGASVAEAVEPWTRDTALAPLRPVARALVRSGASGSGLAAPMSRLAVELRSSRRWQVEAVARRVGVRSAAPLGLCFLPAFVLLGVVPVVVSGARTVGF